MKLLSHIGYQAPRWANHLTQPQHGRVLLAHLPTPIMPWPCAALEDLGVMWSIKRDDMTGLESSGNKARKLEFLMAEALAGGHDSVVTIGGLQSNHCRATAAAARLVGLEPYLVLLVRDSLVTSADVGFQGNLLFSRVLGARLHLFPASEYRRLGGDLPALNLALEMVTERLRSQGQKPYVIAAGGTAPVATWGYIAAVQEMLEQCSQEEACPYDHIVVAAGTGGTAAGLALGCRLAGLGVQVHALNVQHSPEDYFRVVREEVTALGSTPRRDGDVHEWLRVHSAAGAGYGISSPEQLAFIHQVASTTGVVLDHIYSGKALYFFCQYVRENPTDFRGKRILFWHTGGQFALSTQEQQISEVLPPDQLCRF